MKCVDWWCVTAGSPSSADPAPGHASGIRWRPATGRREVDGGHEDALHEPRRLLPGGGGHAVAADHGPDPPRLARHGEPGQARRGHRRRAQPHLVPRSADHGPLPARQRPAAAVHGQAVRVRGPGRRAADPRGRADPGLAGQGPPQGAGRGRGGGDQAGSAWSCTPRAPSRATRTRGRCPARPARCGWRWRPGRR